MYSPVFQIDTVTAPKMLSCLLTKATAEAVDESLPLEESFRSDLSRRRAVYDTAALPLSYGSRKSCHHIGVGEDRVVADVHVVSHLVSWCMHMEGLEPSEAVKPTRLQRVAIAAMRHVRNWWCPQGSYLALARKSPGVHYQVGSAVLKNSRRSGSRAARGTVMGNGRSDRNRTCNLLVPNQALYQVELHSDKIKNGQKVLQAQRVFNPQLLIVIRAFISGRPTTS